MLWKTIIRKTLHFHARGIWELPRLPRSANIYQNYEGEDSLQLDYIRSSQGPGLWYGSAK